MVCLDARKEEVHVPPEHKGNHSLNFILNLNFKKPIEVAEDGICATLSFGGRPFPCVLPMEAIWAAYDPHTGRGQVWGAHAPVEVLEQLGNVAALPKEKKTHTIPTGPPKLVSLPSPKKNKPAPQREGKKRNHLRVIK